MEKFNFEYPFLLGLIFIFIVCSIWCKERSRVLFFPHLDTLLLKESSKALHLITFLKWLGIISVIIAIASPVLVKNYTNSKKEGRDIVLILDSSGSMRQRGFDVNNRNRQKFEVVKEVVNDFIKKRENDRIGLVTFADISFIASPLTFEKEFLEKITSMQRLGVAGERTAINDAIVQAYLMLNRSKTDSKIAILLTDGVDNVSRVNLQEVKELLKNHNIKLYAIGVGNPRRDYNANYLNELAIAGNGKAFGANNAKALSQIYEEIDRLEASKIDNKKVVEKTYLYIYPLFIAIISLLLFLYFRNKKGV